jgi:hypothetical protein
MVFFTVMVSITVSSALAKKREIQSNACTKEQHPRIQLLEFVGFKGNDTCKYRYYRWDYILANHHASTNLT